MSTGRKNINHPNAHGWFFYGGGVEVTPGLSPLRSYEVTRQGTVIRHTLLDSDTYAAMPDNVRSVFLCLILASDDWGRLPDNPLKLNRMISVCCKLPEEITQCIDWMLLDGCLTRYRVGESTFLQWVKWEEHQSRLKSRDRPRYPAPGGELESSTNPLAVAKQSPGGTPDDAPGGIPDGGLKERKGKEKKEPAISFDEELKDFVDEIFPPLDLQVYATRGVDLQG